MGKTFKNQKGKKGKKKLKIDSHSIYLFVIFALQTVALYNLFFNYTKSAVLFAAITFGSTLAPSNVTTYMDSVFGTSLANYRQQLIDNIGQVNAFLHKMMDSDFYEEANGGLFIQEPLMYGLSPADSYDGYDELSTLPSDGITDGIWQWRQVASPIAYSMKEVFQNQHRIVDLVKARIQQAEMGIQEYFAQSLWWGNGTGALTTSKTSPINGSLSVESIPRLISFTPTVSDSPGNIDQSTNSWWQNKTSTSAATTYDNFLLEFNHAYNTAALGTGGPPNLIVLDQTSYELFVQSYFLKYRVIAQNDPNFPFENTKFKQALIVMDSKVPDAYTGAPPSSEGAAMTYGTAYFMNTKFFRIRYDPNRNFDLLENEEGKKFAKPINGDSRIGHVAWMGNCTINQRRKQAVLGKIARTLTA